MTIEELRAQLKDKIPTAHGLATKAEGESRDFTKDERDQLVDLVAECDDLKGKIAKAKSDASVRDRVTELGLSIGLGGDGTKDDERQFKGGDYRAWTKSAAAHIMRGGPDGQKQLISGSYSLPTVLPGIQLEGRAPTSFLGMFANQGITTNAYSYRVQTQRDNQAAPVADGALKPTSTYEFDRVEDVAQVIAHLAGPYPLRFFADESDLQNVLNDEMLYGLQVGLEDQVLNGTGTAPQLRGLEHVSGTQTQAFDTDVLTTLRRAVGKVRTVGLTEPNGIVMNPSDTEDLDLQRDDSGATAGTGQFLLGGPTGPGASSLWRVRVVESLAVTAGSAWVANFADAKVFVREGSRVDTDTAGDLFTHNQVLFRAELRAGFGVTRPASFLKADLTSA
jgi:HK97 family phage major capsid protein